MKLAYMWFGLSIFTSESGVAVETMIDGGVWKGGFKCDLFMGLDGALPEQFVIQDGQDSGRLNTGMLDELARFARHNFGADVDKARNEARRYFAHETERFWYERQKARHGEIEHCMWQVLNADYKLGHL